MRLQALRFPPMLATAILLLLTLIPLLTAVMTEPTQASAAAPNNGDSSSQAVQQNTTSSTPNMLPNQDASSVNDSLAGEQLKGIHTEAVETYWNRLMKDYGGFFPDQKVPSFMEMIMPGGEGLKLTTVLAGLLRYALHEVLYNGKLLVTIVILTVFSMMLETMQTAFERNAVSKVAYSITYMVMIVLAVNSFNVAIDYAKDAITGMIQFMMAMVPLLLTLLATMGSVVTVSVLHPLIIFMIHAVGTVIYTLVFPLLFFSAVLHIASAISDKFKVTQLANVLRNFSVGLMGVMLTVFLGVISVQGATGSVTDGVTMRTAKFITGNFVPVIGRTFSDAADTVMSASLLVKNAIGLAGVVILLFLCAFPAIKILTLALIYNVSAAVLQPLGDSPIVGCLQTIGKTLIYVFAALAAVGLMFFLAVTIILTAGNATVMIR
ncbi:stage III sporulation protein AE [Paenibacillus baekrokdamisoli]|uniref:Stage III sporulation protein AE n=1 Tax=Paenibacillus baekrokdamisoli TaxID=1712516 RepID=A0A3G9IQG6_9BACL|nr:stage III sporulation protein AE [Paenibacillus baekrokdamisoli]MBB3070105.1 stage III sporulation protein AE [Paenibacillus baekrokdamisoli]BBH21117.1 stage III sporulation protein AE [Paenibacillus baekrokdamisoli]